MNIFPNPPSKMQIKDLLLIQDQTYQLYKLYLKRDILFSSFCFHLPLLHHQRPALRDHDM